MLDSWTRWQKLALVLAALGIVVILLWYASAWLAKQGKLKPPTERQGLTSLVGVVFLPVFYWAFSTRQLIPELTFLGLVSYLCVTELTELVRAHKQSGTTAEPSRSA